jgi:hypothetical protein
MECARGFPGFPPGLAKQPVVKVQRGTEAGEAPRRQGATTEHIGNM